jgi:hypothetical protein
VSSPLTPSARSIDPRGQRLGAGLSALILALSFGLWLPWLAILVGVNLGVAALFGSRFFLPGRPWQLVQRVLRLGPVEREHEYPPRFAQALGAAFIGFGAVFFAAGPTPVGWLFVGAVAGLQVLLATTGYCVGCRLYFLRWWVPVQFARVVGRSDALVRVPLAPPIGRSARRR